MNETLCLRIWIFFIFLFPLPLIASTAQLEFKGMPMGSSEKAVKAKFPWLHGRTTSKAERASSDRTCEEPGGGPSGKMSDKGTFAGADAKIIFYFYADKLHRIGVLVREINFDAAVKALTAKYGTPTKTEIEALQNQFGAIFPNHIYRWSPDGGSIRATRNSLLPTKSGNLITNISTIEYFTDFGGQEYERRNRPEQEKFKKDL